MKERQRQRQRDTEKTSPGGGKLNHEAAGVQNDGWKIVTGRTKIDRWLAM